MSTILVTGAAGYIGSHTVADAVIYFAGLNAVGESDVFGQGGLRVIQSASYKSTVSPCVGAGADRDV